MLTIEKSILNKWLDLHHQKVKELYDKSGKQPPQYKSNKEMYNKVIKETEKCKQKVMMEKQRKVMPDLGIAECSKLIIENCAITAVPSKDGYSLAVYDYDKCIYTFQTHTVLNDLIVLIMGMSSNVIISNVVTTLTGMRFEGIPYNPLPKYKIAVGNGIFNCLTQELEEFTPKYTVLTKVKTNYIKNAKKPKYEDGFSLESMIASLANENVDRIELISQICKAIITGHSLKPALFIILGKGGDGKSTFFEMLSNIIGKENVAYVNFSELNSPDKMAETINKKLVLGVDNDVKLYLRKTSLLKTIASHETITLSRKYMNAISVPFTGTMVQLCNDFPRIAETGSSMRRRIVPFRAEYSHYEHGTENANIDNNYINDQTFLEYALWYFLDEEKTPYYSDFNDKDIDLAFDAFDEEDVLGQFISDLNTTGFFDAKNKEVPVSHLYAVYQDWMDTNSPGTKTLSSRSFASQIKEPLRNYGYNRSENNKAVRPNTLQNQGLYTLESFGEYSEGHNIDKAAQKNSSSRTFYLANNKPTQLKVKKRNAQQISAAQYFNIIPSIASDLQLEQKDFIIEDNAEKVETEQHESNKAEDDQSTSTNESDDTDETTLNLMKYYTNNDTQSLENIRDKLRDDGQNIFDNDKDFVYHLDSALKQMDQIVRQSKDMGLKSVLTMSNVSTSSSFEDSIEFIEDFIEELIDYINERKDE